MPNSLGKKMMRIMLVFLGSLLVFPNVSAAAPFDDIGKVGWAKEEIVYLNGQEIINGYPSGSFGPLENISRADAALMLSRTDQIDVNTAPEEPFFSDVDENAYYYKAIQAAVKAGHINGFPDGEYRPEETLTRAQMAKVISVTYGLTGESGNLFSDTSSSWAEKHIDALVINGVTNGYTDGTFKPKSNINRSEFSVMLARAMSDKFEAEINKDMKVHFLDVGQGDSILIETPNGKTILIDGGLQSAGEKIVDYLAKSGITSIDLLVATHPDADHIGGLIDVLEKVEVKRVLDSGKSHTTDTYLEYLNLIDQKNIPFDTAEVGSTIDLDADLEILIVSGINSSNDPNESSIVLKLSHGTVDFLLTGDASSENEETMIQNFAVDAEILKAGHHGSGTSSSQAFLNAVDPEVGILSYGENNYGHPDEKVVDRLSDSGATLYSTYESGDIAITSTGETYTVSAQPWTGEGNGDSTEPDSTTQYPINVNTADYDTLLLIKGVGPSIAQDIIDYRNMYGPFESIEELDNVHYIGPATIEEMSPYITL
ncbi:S-layer homology domain-containing protein [Virgibacillus sp. DJP39]|uniref:S-layer homology domain-containing protein n=1 Tax=Virgibacillus sp. DJP39 TaxID=3409790 RepID=UPI003BB5EA49